MIGDGNAEERGNGWAKGSISATTTSRTRSGGDGSSTLRPLGIQALRVIVGDK